MIQPKKHELYTKTIESVGASKTYQITHKFIGVTENSDSMKTITISIQNISDYNHNNYTDILYIYKLEVGSNTYIGGGDWEDNTTDYFELLTPITSERWLVPVRWFSPEHGLDLTVAITNINNYQQNGKNWTATTSGNLLILEYNKPDLVDSSLGNYTLTYLIRWDMTTGWLNYYEEKRVYESENLQEIMIATTGEAGIPAFGFIGALIGVALIATPIIFLKKPEIQ